MCDLQSLLQPRDENMYIYLINFLYSMRWGYKVEYEVGVQESDGRNISLFSLKCFIPHADA